MVSEVGVREGVDAKGVDRPVAWVGGQPSPMISALVLELAGRGYDVYLPRPLIPSEELEPPWLALRLHHSSAGGVQDGPPPRWDLAVVSDPETVAALTRELLNDARTRPEVSVLLVANSPVQVDTTLRLADSAETSRAAHQITVAAPSRWRRVRLGRRLTTGDVTHRAARLALDGVRERRRFLRYPS